MNLLYLLPRPVFLLSRDGSHISGSSLHNQDKIHVVNPKKTHAHVGNNGNDLSLEVVQKLLQFTLVSGHFEIKAVHSVFHRIPFS
jgi:hypothetical protein